METRYSRNRLYVSDKEQELVKHFPIILGGSGIGSIIAECALRVGFETFTIIDGDNVEKSNLNRQNYVEADIGQAKVSSIEQRLKSINPDVKITCHNCFLTESNAEGFIKGHRVAINALDWTTDIPLVFDKICQAHEIPVLHPYNLGWGGLLTIIMPNGLSLETITKTGEQFNELTMVDYVSSYLKFWNHPQLWIDEIVKKYKEENKQLPPPQLAIASWTVASMCTHVMFNIATGKPIKHFPEFYLLTLLNN